MIEPHAPIAITLPAEQWNTVLTQLAEGPYKTVAPLMHAIQQQCLAHDMHGLTARGGEQQPLVQDNIAQLRPNGGNGGMPTSMPPDDQPA